MHACIVENALLVTPRALILWVARHAQAAVCVLLVRAQNVAFVKRNADGIDVMIAIPCHINLRFIFIRDGFVGILKRFGQKRAQLVSLS
jgi:hypothetical protein